MTTAKGFGYFVAFPLALLAGMAPQAAKADSFYIIGTNDSSGLPCTALAPCGEVTVTASGDDATFTVTSLDAGYVYDNFGFDFSGAGTLSLVSSGGEVSGASLGGSKNLSQWGSFDYVFDTGENGGSHGGDCTITSGVTSAGCTFTFTVSDSSALTASELDSDFAGHMASSSKSGFSGDPVMIPTPEPSSLALLGTGILGLAGIVKRSVRGLRG